MFEKVMDIIIIIGFMFLSAICLMKRDLVCMTVFISLANLMIRTSRVLK